MSRDRLSLAGELSRPGGRVGHLAVDGHIAYLSRDEVTAVNFSDPGQPRAMGTLPTRGSPRRLAVGGGRAFVVTGEGVEVVDVARPGSARHAGVVGTGAVDGVALAGERLFVSDGDAVHCWSVPADVGAARRLGGCGVELCGRLTLRGDLLAVAADCEGMFLLDVADPTGPAVLGVFTGPGDVTRVALSGERALVADYTGGLSVVDISDPRRPRSLGEWDEGIVGDVAAGDGLAYLAMGDLVVVDLSRPGRPRAVGNLSTREGDTAWNLEVAGDLVCALGEGGLSFWAGAGPGSAPPR